MTCRDYTAALATFGENLRRLRHGCKVSQQELAKRLRHANNSTISKWETQTIVPEPATIRDVADKLGIEPWRLMENVTTEYDKLRAAQSSAPVPEVKQTPPVENKSVPLTSPVPDVDPQLSLSGAHVLSTGDPDAAPTYRLSDADLTARLADLADDDRARAIVDHADLIIRLAKGFGRTARTDADPRRRPPLHRPGDVPLRHGRTGTHGRRRKGGRS